MINIFLYLSISFKIRSKHLIRFEMKSLKKVLAVKSADQTIYAAYMSIDIPA